MLISGKEMCELFLKKGYQIVAGGGQYCHIKLRKKKTVVIPSHAELKRGLEQALRKILKENP